MEFVNNIYFMFDESHVNWIYNILFKATSFQSLFLSISKGGELIDRIRQQTYSYKVIGTDIIG